MFITGPPGIEGICFLIILVMIVAIIIVIMTFVRKSKFNNFYKECQLLGLSRSPGNGYFCIGNWREARVAIEFHIHGGNSFNIYMDLGGLPETAIHNIGYYMQGLVSDMVRIEGFKKTTELDRAVSGSWNGLYLQSNRMRNAGIVELRQMLERMYFARTELLKRIYGVR